MELFSIEENQVIIKPELRLIPQFKKIIARDKDRAKHQAMLELAYIYYMYDYKSPYMNVAADFRHEQITRHLKFKEGWKVDPDLQEAINTYLEFTETASVKVLKSTKDALINAANVITVLNNIVSAALKTNPEVNIDQALEHIENLLTISEKLPKTIGVLSLLEEKVKKEQHEESKVRGGGKAGVYED